MKWLKNAWNWLSGKKTAIGAAMLMASRYVEEPTIKAILGIGGEILTAGGLVHKVSKTDLPSGLSEMTKNLRTYWKK